MSTDVTNSYAGFDPNSLTWRAVTAWAEARLAGRRRSLEGAGRPIDETENDRGAIEELKALIAFGDRAVSQDVSPLDESGG